MRTTPTIRRRLFNMDTFFRGSVEAEYRT
jgi:hypothetical protein